MKTFMLALLSASVIASGLSALLLLLSPALSKRYSARAVSAAFLIVLLSFLALWSPVKKPAAVTLELPKAETLLTLRLPAPVVQKAPSVLPNAPGTGNAESTAALETVATGAAKQSEGRAVSLYDVLFILWAAGACTALWLQSIKHARFLRAVRRWKRPAPDAYRRALNEAAYELNLRRIPQIAVCPVVDGPMLYGLKAPCILIPTPDMPDAALLPILRHELTHYRRHDIQRRLLSLPVLVIEWFNPFAYFAARGQAFYAEVACDERATKDAPFTARKDYAQVILYSIRGRGARSALSTGFKGGKKQMKKRIETVLSGKSKRVGVSLVCVMLSLALLLSGALALTESQAPDAKETAARAKAQYTQEYGDFFFWPAAVKGSYTDFCAKAGIPTDDGVQYLWWEDVDIEYAQAMNIVRKEMGADGIEDIFFVGTSVFLRDNIRTIKFELKPMAKTEANADCTFLLEASNGRIISASIADGAAENTRKAKAALDDAQGQAQAELAAKYGENSAYWPLEAKAALYHAADAYKSELSSDSLTIEVPGANDLPLEKAREIADGYFKDTFGVLPSEVEGREVKRAETFYVQRSNPENRCYVFAYASGEGTESYVNYGELSILSPSGEKDNSLYLGGFLYTHALENAAEPRSEHAKRQYTGEYGDFFLWPSSIKAAYTDRCVEEGKLPEDGNRYLDWDTKDISEDEIERIILNELGDGYYGGSMEFSFGVIMKDGRRVYLVKLRPTVSTGTDAQCVFVIATPSGEVLEKSIPDGIVTAARESLRAADAAQSSFYADLAKQYGDDQDYWPLEAKKQYSDYMHPNPTFGTLLDSLPEAADLTPEQATALSDAAFEKTFGVSPDGLIKTEKHAYKIKRAVSFYTEAMNETQGRYYQIKYYATLDEQNADGIEPTLYPIYLGFTYVQSPSGNVTEGTLDESALTVNEESMERESRLNEKTKKDGLWPAWTFEEIVAYKDDLGFDGYTLADEGSAGQLSKDSVIALARQYILGHFPQVNAQVYYGKRSPKIMTKEAVDALKVCAVLVTPTESEGETAYWDVFLYEDEWFELGLLDCFDIRIDAATGAVLVAFEPGGNG